jgi:hypothetical protein
MSLSRWKVFEKQQNRYCSRRLVAASPPKVIGLSTIGFGGAGVRPHRHAFVIMRPSPAADFCRAIVTTPLIPTDRFSFNSHRMLGLRDTVLQVWEDQVLARLPRAQGIRRPVLTDTMPVLYERLSAALSPEHFERDGLEVSTLGAEHGVERANLTDYDADTIVAEFQLFRSVLFDVLDAHEVALTGPERRALHLTIDAAVRESVRAFVVAGNALRERVAGAHQDRRLGAPHPAQR